MDEVKFITNYLDKNYSVRTGYDRYQVLEINHDSSMGLERFLKDFHLIFGNYILEDGNESSSVMYDWFESKKVILGKKLNKALNKIDGTKGSDGHLKDLLELFKNDTKFNVTFITNEFKTFYKSKFIDVKIDNYISTVKLSNGSMFLDDDLKLIFFLDIQLFGNEIAQRVFGYYQAMMSESIDEYLNGLDTVANSNELINNSPLNVEIENEKILKPNLKVLNEWYHERFIREKLDDFFNELVITLGPNNWRVTWIGHGELTKDKILYYLREDKYHLSYITQRYDEWYSNAIIEASERYMKF